MKKALILISFVVFVFSAKAQDILIKSSGDELKVKIIEIGVSEIKYKRFDFQDGPSYSIAKNEVLMIRYENGVNEVITKSAPKVDNSPSSSPTPTPSPSSSSSPNEEIEYSMGNYTQNDRYISKSRVISTLKSTKDVEIMKYIRKSKTTITLGGIFAGALGVPLMVVGSITAIVGVASLARDRNPDASGIITVGAVMAGTGIALQFANIGFAIKSRKTLEKGIAIYNEKYVTKAK